jgi:prepilin peptidase CpaA
MPRIGFEELMLATIIPAALVASWKDYREHRVPNWLNASIALSGLAAQTAFNGWAGLESALAGMLLAFGMLVIFWAIKGMGAGDVKFMAAIGAWLGPHLTANAVVVGGLAGGLLAVGIIVCRRRWGETFSNFRVLVAKVCNVHTAFSEFGSAKSLSGSTALLPYAIPLSVGALVVAVSNYSGWWKVL